MTIKAPRLAQPGEIVRVDGRAIGGSSIFASALFRVSRASPGVWATIGPRKIHRKMIRISEGRFRTWTRFSEPGRYTGFPSSIQETTDLKGARLPAQQRERQDPGDLAALVYRANHRCFARDWPLLPDLKSDPEGLILGCARHRIVAVPTVHVVQDSTASP